MGRDIRLGLVLLLLVVLTPTAVTAHGSLEIEVDCDRGDSLHRALLKILATSITIGSPVWSSRSSKARASSTPSAFRYLAMRARNRLAPVLGSYPPMRPFGSPVGPR